MRCQRGVACGDASCVKVGMKSGKARDCVLKALHQRVRIVMDARERQAASLKKSNPKKDVEIVQKVIQSEKMAWMKLYDEYADGKLNRERFLELKKEYDGKVEKLKKQLEEAEFRVKQMELDRERIPMDLRLYCRQRSLHRKSWMRLLIMWMYSRTTGLIFTGGLIRKSE